MQTDAKNTVIAGLHGNALKIKLAAAPVEGRANAVLARFFAQHFDVPVCQVVLKQGDESRYKIIVIQQPVYGPDALLKPQG